MEKRIRTGRRVAKISVLVDFCPDARDLADVGSGPGPSPDRVVDNDGEPFAGVVIRLQSADGGSVGQGSTSGVNGRFRIPGVAPGTYTVTATADGFQPASQSDRNVPRTGRSRLTSR